MAHPVHVEVRLRENESAERLIRRFTKKIKKERVLDLYREHQYFLKPSAKRRAKAKKRLQVLKKLAREQEGK